MKSFKRYEVFISSTYNDLKKERVKVMQTIIDLGHIPVGMELFNASNDTQWEVITKQIDQCDYYVLIVSDRYGSIDSGGISYTEKEYDYALKLDKPIIIFLREERSIEKLPSSKREDIEKDRLLKFREKIKSNRVVEFWKKKNDLAYKFMKSFNTLINDDERIGWIRADSLTPDHVDLLKEKSQLIDEYNELKLKNDEHIKDSPIKTYKDFEYCWPKIEEILDSFIKEQRGQGETLKLRLMGLSLHKSFERVSEFIRTRDITNVRIEIRLLTLNPNPEINPIWKLLDNKWTALFSSLEIGLNELKSFLINEETKLKVSVDSMGVGYRNDISIKHYQFKHMPNFHGVMINGEDLFLSSCMWDSHGKLSTGQNFYEHYKSGLGLIHNHKIKLYRRWFDYGRYKGTTKRTDALFFQSADARFKN